MGKVIGLINIYQNNDNDNNKYHHCHLIFTRVSLAPGWGYLPESDNSFAPEQGTRSRQCVPGRLVEAMTSKSQVHLGTQERRLKMVLLTTVLRKGCRCQWWKQEGQLGGT